MDPSLLSTRQLTKRFGTRTAVDGVSFAIQPGEAVGLLGPNGAGKTTTISLLTGLLHADGGEVLLDGRPLTGDTDPRKRLLGLVPQELALYEELTARDNLAYFGALQGLRGPALSEAARSALGFVGLADRERDKVKTYSGGMKRRLNLAVALLHDPQLLLLDEPTVGVDPQSRNAIFENIEALRRRGKTILYTTHYMEEVERLCDRVIIMDHGRIIVDDSLAGLKQRGTSVNRLRVELAEVREGTWLESVRALSAVRAAEFDALTLELTVADIARGTTEVLACLQHHGLTVTGLATHQPSLEDVFLQLTGRTLRDV